MRLHGFCTSCRRIKLVSISGHELVRAGRAVQGICADCADPERCTCGDPKTQHVSRRVTLGPGGPSEVRLLCRSRPGFYEPAPRG